MDGVRDYEGAVVAHEEYVLVPEHFAEPLALLDHGGGLVTRVVGTPVKEPATLVYRIGCQCQGKVSGVTIIYFTMSKYQKFIRALRELEACSCAIAEIGSRIAINFYISSLQS